MEPAGGDSLIKCMISEVGGTQGGWAIVSMNRWKSREPDG